jgi:hypothetical protein
MRADRTANPAPCFEGITDLSQAIEMSGARARFSLVRPSRLKLVDERSEDHGI